MKIIHISFGGPDRKIKDESGKLWKFEMHPYCGPAVVDRHGDPKATQPGPRSPFWTAVTQWVQQGSVIGREGLCVWAPVEKPQLVHLGGRNYAEAGSALALKHSIQAAPISVGDGRPD